MKLFLAAIICASLAYYPIYIEAGTILLKNGRKIDVNRCWEDGDLVKCEQYGAVVGYKKGDVKEVFSTPASSQEQPVSSEKPISIDDYRIRVMNEIQNLWKYYPDLSNASGKEVAAITFDVLPNGEITEIVFEELSGDPHLDESAIAAVAKASPVQPHPSELSQSKVEMTIRFTPSGIQ